MQRLAAFALIALCAAGAWAQAPYLVTDINTSYTPNAVSSSPTRFVAAGSSALFSATTDNEGTELFKTDGVTVELVRDIVPGTIGSGPQFLFPLSGSTVVFAANTPESGTELWKSDGTEAGTVLVKDILIGGQGSNPIPRAEMGGKVFFTFGSAGDAWITDGTDGGTKKLVDSPQSGGFVALGGFMYFYSGYTLFKSDGTPEGTTVVRNDVYIRTLSAAGSKLFFTGWDSAHGYELWVSDGTANGTVLLKDINPGAFSSFNTNVAFSLAPVGSSIVFFAYQANIGWSLWRSDGTADGTVAVLGFPIWTSSTIPPFLYSMGGLAFFSSDGLWRSDATLGGTFKLTTVFQPSTFVAGATKVFFFASDANDSSRLWATDGTDAGTAKVSTAVRPGAPASMAWVNGKLYFSGNDGFTGSEPWVSDGTPNGTNLIANMTSDPPASSSPDMLRGANGTAYFTATNGVSREMWVSDSTPAGTSQLTTIGSSLGFRQSAALNGGVFFVTSASTGSTLQTLWFSDGTVAGTIKLKENTTIEFLTTANGYAYFGAGPGTYYDGTRLWRSDGTVAGTIDLTSASDVANSPREFVELGGHVYFEAGSPRGIWRTDGTPQSTVRITTHPGSYASSSGMRAAQGMLFYVLSTYELGSELWRTDIGSQSTTITLDMRPGSSGSFPQQLVSGGSLVFFTADDGVNGREIWRSDGTMAGTFLLKDILPGPSSSSPASLTTVNGRLFFVASNGFDGTELWTSDGTPAGTVMVADIAPGGASSLPDSLIAADGLLWFAAEEGTAGRELWKSDGTAGGTQRVADLYPGASSSTPRFLTLAGRRMYFSAHTTAGRELWALDLASSSFAINDARGGESGGPLRFTITRSGDLSQPASVSYATSNGTATSGSDYTTQNGSASFGSGIAEAFVDVALSGDSAAEDDETLFVTLSAPSAGIVERHLGSGIIEDDDRSAALSLNFINTRSSYNGNRTYVVTNVGPSSASDVVLRITETPTAGTLSASGCTQDGFGRLVCRLGTVLVGESRTIAVSSSYYSYSGLYDQANPPGFTVTAVVATSTLEADLTDNTVSFMITIDGGLITPPYLQSSTTATAKYQAYSTSSYPQDVTLTSSNSGVTVTPPTATIPSGDFNATFTLNVGNVTGSTLLTATHSYNTYRMVVPIIGPSGTARLDPMIVKTSETYFDYGEDVVVTVRIAGRRADGGYPTGLVSLLDATNAVLQQQTLDGTGVATFTRSGLQPGTYSHKVRYEGDASFNPLTVAIESVYVRAWSTSTTLDSPLLTCDSSVSVTVTVKTSDTATSPTGTVLVTAGTQSVQGTLVASGTGASKATVQVPVTSSVTSISATYQPTGAFVGGYNYGSSRSISVGCVAMNLVATATAGNRVVLTWTGTGASTYEVYRLSPSGYLSGFSFLGYAGAATYLDTTVVPGRAYLYRVRPTGGAYSAPDLAMTYFFTDDPIVPRSTVVKFVHVTELMSAINLARELLVFNALTFTNAPVYRGNVQSPALVELRTGLNDIRRQLGLPQLSLTDPALTTGMPIKAAHIQEMRNGLK